MASLGLIPPRIAGIQVYDGLTGRKEMDVDFFFAGDLEILFSFKGFPATWNWIHLQETDSAVVQVSLSLLPVVTDPEIVKKVVATSSGEDANSNGLVHIYIDYCTGLTMPGDPSYTPTPVVRISGLFDKVEQSRAGEKSSEPVIEQGSVLLVRSVYTEEVRIEILDAARDIELVGRCTVQAWTLPARPRPLLV